VATESSLVRTATGLFMAGGLLSFVAAWLPGSGIRSGNVVDAVGLAAVVAGALVWVVPWERWPSRVSLVLVPLALGLVAVADGAGSRSPFTFGAYFMIVFAWVGLCQPPLSCLWLAPLAVPAYLLPAWARGTGVTVAVASMVITVTVGVIVGETVAWAMEQARRARASAEHRASLLHVVAASSNAGSDLAPDAILAGAVRSAVAMGLDWAGVAAYSADGASWKLVSHCGPFPSGGLLRPQPADSGLPGQVRARGRPVLLVDAGLTAAAVAPALEPRPLVSLVGAPMAVHGTAAAVLLGAAEHRVLAPEDMEAMALLAAQAGRHLEGAARLGEERKARQHLALESVRDELTGVGNRRHAAALLDSLEPEDAVVMLDLDHFKSVNDTYGHQEGDRVLQALAEHLRQGLRGVDAVARYGGEEFVAVLKGVGEGGVNAVERLASAWRATGPVTTFSAGVAVHRPGATAESTLARADAALYAAKRAGRDRVQAELAEVL
jgi:diguanylate cyclase (GGDEF)-like protein